MYRRSLVHRISFEDCSPSEDTARRDSAVHVSLSSYSPVKQPGTMAVPLSGEPESRRSLRPPTEVGCLSTLISEELRRRAVAPCKRTARRMVRYIVVVTRECQHLIDTGANKFAYFRIAPACARRVRGADMGIAMHNRKKWTDGPLPRAEAATGRTWATFLEPTLLWREVSGRGIRHHRVASAAAARCFPV